MIIKGRKITLKQMFYLSCYYGIFRFLPLKGGKIIRRYCCKHIFKKCGKNVNIERLASFGCGIDIEIGDNSGIGVKASIPSNTIIGNNVMMGPNCCILPKNHSFDRTDIPMIQQGFSPRKQTVIEDDVWIGRNVLIMPGRII